MSNNQYQRIVPFVIFILALLLLFSLVRPTLTIILGSILLAYVTFPLYERVRKRVPKQSLAIILSLAVVILIILIPFSFLAFEMTKEGYVFYNSLSTKIEKGALFGFGCTSAESRVCSLLNQAEKFSAERLSTFGFDTQLLKLLPILEERITRFILSIPVMLAQVFLTVVISYFILKDWRAIMRRAINLLPMRTKTIKRLTHEFGDIAYTVIYAQLFVALVQGIIGTIGFYLFGVPFPIVLGVVLAFFALIPTIGTALIWLPAAVYLMVGGYLSQDYLVLWKGIGLLLYGMLIISTIDNILLARIVHARTKVSQILIIVGVIGGASLFGIVGIFVGPIVLPLLVTYFETFKERFV